MHSQFNEQISYIQTAAWIFHHFWMVTKNAAQWLEGWLTWTQEHEEAEPLEGAPERLHRGQRRRFRNRPMSPATAAVSWSGGVSLLPPPPVRRRGEREWKCDVRGGGRGELQGRSRWDARVVRPPSPPLSAQPPPPLAGACSWVALCKTWRAANAARLSIFEKQQSKHTHIQTKPKQACALTPQQTFSSNAYTLQIKQQENRLTLFFLVFRK